MPAKTELAKFALRGQVVESAANTFTEATINTSLAPEGNMLFVATGLWMSHNALLELNGDIVQLQLAYTSQTAIIGPNDPDWICGLDHTCEDSAGTGTAHNYSRMQYTPLNYWPLAQSQLFFGVAGVSLAAAVTGNFKLEGYLQKVTVTEFFRITRLR